MADESKGILGHLPPLPRKALNNSVIGMEQAYRQRKGLPLLSDADIEALKAGEPMPWERGDGAGASAVPTATAQAPAAVAASPTPAAVVASGPISEDVAKWVGEGKKWSKSAIAAEQARRARKGLPALNDAEIAALLGEPAAPAAAPAQAPAAQPTAAPAPRPVATAAAPVSRAGQSTRYVGTPAVGTSKAAAAAGVAAVGPEDNEINRGRRQFAWTAVA